MEDSEHIRAACEHLRFAIDHLEHAGLDTFAKYARWAREPSLSVLESLEEIERGETTPLEEVWDDAE